MKGFACSHISQRQRTISPAFQVVIWTCNEGHEVRYCSCLNDFEQGRCVGGEICNRQGSKSAIISILLEGLDERSKSLLLNQNIYQVRVRRQICDCSRCFKTAGGIWRRAQGNQGREAVLFEKSRVNVRHFHEIGYRAAGMTLDVAVPRHQHTDQSRNSPVRNFFLVLSFGREAIQGRRNFPDNIDVARPRHKNEGIQNPFLQN
mmetsp:Transcript_30666/g.64246  ORF Transcript_30666/g.64246 Transcript_30666/m.64246 type:complete len:204 (+) Transcript_30666:9921-10532(+)